MAKKWADGTSQFELPFSEGYSKYISTKNLDFKKDHRKDVRLLPDIVKEFQVWGSRPQMEESESDQGQEQALTIASSMSPVRKRVRRSPQKITKNKMDKPEEDWRGTIQLNQVE